MSAGDPQTSLFESTEPSPAVAAADAETGAALQRLNGPQADAVAHASGPLIVFAGAGSGKTRVITYRIANLVATHGVAPYRILAVTFTNKAAAEMRHRLAKILGDDLTQELWIGTFHAVCVKFIRRYHEEIGISKNFVIYDDSDQKALMRRVMDQLDLDDRRIAPQKVLGRIAREKQEGRGPAQMEVSDYFGEITKRCYEAYQARLVAANAVDFADLLLLALRLAEDPDSEAGKHLRSRFSYVLVDEFQDVNQVQYRLVRALAASHQNICVVGDDDQSIYRWRGADVRNIRGFTRDFANATLIKLEQNYRSSKNVVSAALGVIRWARDRQPKELWTDNDDGAPVRIVHTANERDEAAWIVSQVSQRLAEGVSPKEVAVFYRVHAQSRVLEEVMRSEGVPYQIVGGTRFFDRAEVKDLLSYLKVVVNPASDVDLLRIINKPPRKIGKKTIDRLVAKAARDGSSLFEALEPLCESDELNTGAKRALRAFTVLMAGFQMGAETASPKQLTEDVLKATGYAVQLRKQDSVEADARLENLQELLGSIAEYEEEKAYADEKADVADYLARITLQSAADTLEEVPRVPMMTIHAAKGLEFDHVYLSGMEEGLFPLRGQEPGQEEELEEERRLAYVGITRARQHLAMSHANTRTIYGQMRYNQPSRFLADIPAKHQVRVASATLHELSTSFTRGASVGFRDQVRAGAPGARPGAMQRPPPMGAPKPASRQAGERFIEEVHDDFSGDDNFERDAIRAGGRVRHSKFGVGVVQEVGSGPDPVVVVKFEGWSHKRIKSRFLDPA